MVKIICIASQKGGVGKTTTAVNLSTALAMAEKRTLLVDCDPQGHATVSMGSIRPLLKKTLYRVMTEHLDIREALMNTQLTYLQLLPSEPLLYRAEWELRERPRRDWSLSDSLDGIRGDYEYIILDSPPSVSLLAANAVTAADSVLIPLQCEFYALEGMARCLAWLRAITKKSHNSQLRILGILLTMFDPEDPVSREIAKAARTHFGRQVFKTVIPRHNDLREFALYGKSLLLRDIRSVGARSFLELAKEIIEYTPLGGKTAGNPEKGPIALSA